MKEEIEVEKSSGNVFADLGLPDANDMYVKTLLAIKINAILQKRKLKQKDAAKILGVTQTRIPLCKIAEKSGIFLSIP